MKLITNANQASLIKQVLVLAENVAFGEVGLVFSEYASSYKINLKVSDLLALQLQSPVVFPSRIAEIRELRKEMEASQNFELEQLIRLARILEGYARIGQAQFEYVFDEFTELDQGRDLMKNPAYADLRKDLTNLDQNAYLMINEEQPYNFRLAFEMSKKIIRDLSWIQYPLGGISNNFELPYKMTKDPFVEVVY